MRVTIPFHLACGYCPYCQVASRTFARTASFRKGPLLRRMGAIHARPTPPGVFLWAWMKWPQLPGCRYMTAWRAIQSKGGIRGGNSCNFRLWRIGLAATEIASVGSACRGRYR
jgi:hypothetical protein